MNHASVPDTHRRLARKMRKSMTEAELKLWNEIRAHRLMGLGFRRQLPISGYIVDFACPEKKLVIEIDGSHHGEAGQAEADRIRDAKLQSLGWTVLRFWNDDVLRDVAGVCQHVVVSAGRDEPGPGKEAAA
ncbi:endonuclease domain-containing protein [Mesorhizobium sp. L-8-3]|uniref:endonuclease domain-containing protein n=1 Tax=Mesorhizobium sp. L-8-3 TaxID=2744522 RepID=UPI001927BB18|nr:endonuclease domain-containing protein [Mesorhizobium sp. L-8-3]